jgi:hypothetical protein
MSHNISFYMKYIFNFISVTPEQRSNQYGPRENEALYVITR